MPVVTSARPTPKTRGQRGRRLPKAARRVNLAAHEVPARISRGDSRPAAGRGGGGRAGQNRIPPPNSTSRGLTSPKAGARSFCVSPRADTYALQLTFFLRFAIGIREYREPQASRRRRVGRFWEATWKRDASKLGTARGSRSPSSGSGLGRSASSLSCSTKKPRSRRSSKRSQAASGCSTLRLTTATDWPKAGWARG